MIQPPKNNPLVKKYEKILGEPFKLIEKKSCIRINTIKNPMDIKERLQSKGAVLERVPFLPNAYWYESKRSLGATTEYLLGYYYLQEAASQLPALVLDPPKHATVLDMAAAPGSKTTQLSALMDNTGVIVAVELKSHRMESLISNIERCGVKNAVVYRKDARFVKDLHKKFTHILLDAPCSGNPVIEKDFFTKKSEKTILEMQKIQRELLKSALEVLAPRGILVYSTCSLEPEENELQIDWLLEKYPDLELVDTGLNVGDEGLTSYEGNQLPENIRKTRRLWPQKNGTQAFFIAKLRRK